MRHTEHPTSPALPPVPLLLALGDKPEDSVPVSDLWRVVGTVDLHDRDLGPEWAEKTVFLETERDGRRLIDAGFGIGRPPGNPAPAPRNLVFPRVLGGRGVGKSVVRGVDGGRCPLWLWFSAGSSRRGGMGAY